MGQGRGSSADPVGIRSPALLGKAGNATQIDNTSRTRSSYFALLATTTGAALLKESRMKFISATVLDRKSGRKAKPFSNSPNYSYIANRPVTFAMDPGSS
jgi:hypothetical protein